MASVHELKRINTKYYAGTGPTFTLTEEFLKTMTACATLKYAALRVVTKPAINNVFVSDTGFSFLTALVTDLSKKPYSYITGADAGVANNVNVTPLIESVISNIATKKYATIAPLEGLVKFYYTDPDPQYRTTDYISWYLEWTFTKKPSIQSVAPGANLNTRLPITINWTSTNQDVFEVDVLQNGISVFKVAGTSARSIEIPANKLSAGKFTVNLIVGINPVDDWGETVTTSTELTAISTAPKITALEPNDVNRSVDSAIDVTWTCDLQETYSLKVYADDILINAYQGETQKSIRLPAGTLPPGIIRLELATFNSLSGIIATDSKQAMFTGYGKPQKPVFEDKEIYSQAKPTINWTSLGQIAYVLNIYKAGALVETSGEVISGDTSYTTTSVLENNTIYDISLKIKNRFNEWSVLEEKQILISYTELPKPNFTLNPEKNGVLVSITYNPNTPNLKSMEVWRKRNDDEYKRIGVNIKADSQFTDTTLASGELYYYKVRAIGTDGGISESDAKSSKYFLEHFIFQDIDSKEAQTLIMNPKISISNVVDITTRYFAGSTKAKVERGPKNYKRMTCSFVIESRDYKKVEAFFHSAKVILFRDGRGEKFYGAITSPINSDYILLNKSSISFTFEEVNFIEKDLYSDLKLILTYFNGAYFFDGSIDFSGETIG